MTGTELNLITAHLFWLLWRHKDCLKMGSPWLLTKNMVLKSHFFDFSDHNAHQPKPNRVMVRTCNGVELRDLPYLPVSPHHHSYMSSSLRHQQVQSKDAHHSKGLSMLDPNRWWFGSRRCQCGDRIFFIFPQHATIHSWSYLVEGDEQLDWPNSQTTLEFWHVLHNFFGYVQNTTAFCLARSSLHLLLLKSSMIHLHHTCLVWTGLRTLSEHRQFFHK